MPPTQDMKHRIAQSFSNAANSYEHAALAQKRIANTLLEKTSIRNVRSILDLGCGCGTQFDDLTTQFRNANIVGLDFSEAMLKRAIQTKNSAIANTASKPSNLDNQITACLADLDKLPFARQSFELVYSSLAVQWSNNLAAVLNQVHSIIKPGGKFAFSTLVEGNFVELSKAWQAVDSYQHSNPYDNVDQHRLLVDNSDFSVEIFEQSTLTLYFDSLRHLFKNLRQTGVTTVLDNPRKGLLTPSQYTRLERQYETFRTDRGLPASYRVLYCVLKRQP